MSIISETQCLRIKLKKGTTQKVREWCKKFQTHPELGDVLEQESVIVETLMLDEQEDATYLIFYLKAESLEKANDFLTKTQHPINDLSNAFMQECWDMTDVKILEPILDLNRIKSIG